MDRRARTSYILLALLTLTVLAGPLGFGYVLRGGARPDWPPDRAVEWLTLAAATMIVVVLMVSTIALGLAMMRRPRDR